MEVMSPPRRSTTNPSNVPIVQQAPTWGRIFKWVGGGIVGFAGIIVTITTTLNSRPTRAEVAEDLAPLEARTQKCETRIGGIEKSLVEVVATQRWEVKAIEAMLTHDGIYAVPPPPVGDE